MIIAGGEPARCWALLTASFWILIAALCGRRPYPQFTDEGSETQRALRTHSASHPYLVRSCGVPATLTGCRNREMDKKDEALLWGSFQ